MDASTAKRLGKIAPLQTLVLTHYGRKSGKPYEVTIWFVVEGERMFLGTAKKSRNWARNVLVKPNVSLNAGGETFKGKVNEITDGTLRDHVMGLIQAKYWYAMPVVLLGRALQRLGLMQDNSGAFEVKIDAPAA